MKAKEDEVGGKITAYIYLFRQFEGPEQAERSTSLTRLLRSEAFTVPCRDCVSGTGSLAFGWT
jgi:hypothetical protein